MPWRSRRTPHLRPDLGGTRPRAHAPQPHGEDVGLPPGQIGNSEVGHTNIGAGRVVWMDLPKINRAIDDGTFFDANPELDPGSWGKLKADRRRRHT